MNVYLSVFRASATVGGIETFVNKTMMKLSLVTAGLLVGHFVLHSIKSPLSTTMWIISSIATAAFCFASAVELLKLRSAIKFAVIAMVVGWAAEQIGTIYGVPFGSYTYTEVLGPKLGSVPFVIPLMWFSFTYIAYVMINLTVWQRPTHTSGLTSRWADVLLSSLLVGMLLAVYDLVADPYMVKVAKAWIMLDPGSYFGETAVGFFGWLLTGFLIVLSFQLLVPHIDAPTPDQVHRYSAAYPLLAFAFYIGFFVAQGEPLETRSIAFYGMGLPLLAAFAGWRRWATQQTEAP